MPSGAFQTGVFNQFVESGDFSQPPFRVARCQRHVAFAIGAIEDQRRALRKQSSRFCKQPLGGGPRADVTMLKNNIVW